MAEDEVVLQPPAEAHVVLRTTIAHTQVCSVGTEAEALEWLNTTMPTGISSPWQKDEHHEARPVPCEKFPERTHYLFEC